VFNVSFQHKYGYIRDEIKAIRTAHKKMHVTVQVHLENGR